MNLHHLGVFHAVAGTGNFTAAAERLMTGQPVVSRQVAALEKALGVVLVERLPRGVKLTEAGALLAGYAQRIFAMEEEAARALAELQGLKRGRLRVGASLTIGSYLLPGLLAKFGKRYPGIEMSVEIANTQEVEQRLMAGRVDVGMTEGFAEGAGLLSRVFAMDALVVIVGKAHPLAARAKAAITAKRLCDDVGDRFIFREEGSGTREVVERALAAKGLRVRPGMVLGSTEAIKGAVAAGLGVGVLSRLAVERQVKARELVVLNIGDLELKRALYVQTAAGRIVGGAGGAFLRMV